MSVVAERGLRRSALTGVLPALSLLAVLGPMTTDLYLPAFPRMAADLHASAGQIQWSLSATLLGVAAGQLIFGPVSDSVGRRWPLLAATGIHVAASIATGLAGSIEWMLAWRLLQGFGASGVSVLALAITRDAFDGRRLVRVLARLALLSGLAPVAAPVLGSFLLRLVDWRGVFFSLALYGLFAVTVCAIVLPETSSRSSTLPGAPRSARHRYLAVLRDRGLLGAAVIGATMAGCVFAYVSASSFAFQSTYGLDANGYALVFAFNATAFALGSQLAARGLRRFSPPRLLGLALATALVAAAGIAACSVLPIGVAGFTAAAFVALLAAGACMPTIQVVALEQHAQQAGTAASVFGFINFGFASLISPMSSIGDDRILALGALLAVLSCVALVSLQILIVPELRRREHGPASQSCSATSGEGGY